MNTKKLNRSDISRISLERYGKSYAQNSVQVTHFIEPELYKQTIEQQDEWHVVMCKKPML